jgi:hypothetical protein
MQNLFDRGGLKQTDGELNEIWNQEGRSQIDATGSGTLHTVTSGKTAYIKAFSWSNSAAPGRVDLQDGSTDVHQSLGAQDETYVFIFDVPMKFTTSIVVNKTGSGTLYANVVGWEE